MDSNITIQNLYDQAGLLDILVSVEEYLDNMDLYAYKNWIEGEIVEGPIVSKYWVEVTLKYTRDVFPDPRGALIFENQGTLITIKKDYEVKPIQHPRSEEDMQIVATAYGIGAGKLPKDVREPILLVRFRIPRRLVDPASFDEYKLNSNDFNQNPLTPSDEETAEPAPEEMDPNAGEQGDDEMKMGGGF